MTYGGMEMDDISVHIVLSKLAEFNLLLLHICLTHLGHIGLNIYTHFYIL